MPDERLIASRAFSRCRHRPLTAPLWRYSTGQAARVRVPTSLLRRTQARSPPSRPGTVSSLTHVGADCADRYHGVPRTSPYGMIACETHAGRTQCMSLSAADDWERSCGRMRDHARGRLMDVRHTRNERRHESQEGRACRALSTRRSCWTTGSTRL